MSLSQACNQQPSSLGTLAGVCLGTLAMACSALQLVVPSASSSQVTPPSLTPNVLSITAGIVMYRDSRDWLCCQQPGLLAGSNTEQGH